MRFLLHRPIAGFKESHCDSTGVHYAHNSGEVNFRRRAPLQLASTLGFVLSKQDGKFMRLKNEELDALHNCLTWLRVPGNNPLNFYGHRKCKWVHTPLAHAFNA